ncbi:MAG: response regulator [Desulfobacterales bacterium]|nr:response regulator [Desulfobacterales bacterium]
MKKKHDGIKISIREKLLMVMIGLIVSLVMMLMVLQISTQKKIFKKELALRIALMKKNLNDQGKTISENLVRQVEEAIASYNLYNITEVLKKSVNENQDLTYAILMDYSGVAYVHTQYPELQQEKLTDPVDEYATRQYQSIVHEYEKGSTQYAEYIIPIKVSTEPWGVLRLGFSLAQLNLEIIKSEHANTQEIEDMIQRTSITSLIFVIISALIVFFISSRLSKPIIRLTESARELARGHFSLVANIIVKSKDEIGLLSSTFAEMSEKLKISYHQIEEYSRNLELKVKERTKELQEKNFEIEKTLTQLKHEIKIRKAVEDELRQAKAIAEAATRSKSEFLANMSHEIRTPMNAIMGLTHLALKTSQLTPKIKDYLLKIKTSSQLLLGIINDILDFSKIEAGKLNLEKIEFQLYDIIENLSSIFGNRLSEKMLEYIILIEEDVPCSLMGDPLRLGQILINLTSNAIKFTDTGEIVMKVKLLEKHEKIVSLRFEVKDTGIGIEQDKVSKLFESFAQADGSTTRKYGGTGLGLTISKRLVEMMNGRIWIESQTGVGSTFIFTANFDMIEDKIKKKEISSTELKGLKALVIDDNQTTREVIRDMISPFGIVTTLAASGEEGLDVLKQESNDFGLVMIDWQLQHHMEGFNTIMKIRNDLHLQTLPVIVMVSTFLRDEAMQYADKANINAFLTKPVNQSLLFDTIMEAIHHKIKEKEYDITISEKELSAMEKVKGARILLVEDNFINQQVAMEILESAGIIVDLADNGKKAIKAIENAEYDLVLMDVQMPEMDGLEATRHIRKNEKYHFLPIIAMTAHTMEGDRDRCIDAGMNDYVTKPMDTEKLFIKLAEWISPKRKLVYYPTKHTPPNQTTESNNPEKKSFNDMRMDHYSNVKPNMDENNLPDNLPGIDIKSALGRLRGNKDLLLKILEEFAKDYPDAAQHIQKAYESGNLTLAGQIVHSIKGISGNFSADNLHAACIKLEYVIKQHEHGEFNEKIELFSSALTQLLASARSIVQIYRANKPKSTQQPTDTSKLPVLIIELAQLLKDNDLDAIDLLNTIKAYLPDARFSAAAKKLENNINQLDFVKAIEALNEIAKLLDIPL